jgi:hypothetical protein
MLFDGSADHPLISGIKMGQRRKLNIGQISSCYPARETAERAWRQSDQLLKPRDEGAQAIVSDFKTDSVILRFVSINNSFARAMRSA